MSKFKNAGVGVEEYLYDFSVDGGAVAELVLSDKANYAAMPEGSIIKDVVVWVEEACTSGGSATVEFGNSTDTDGYHASIAVADLTANAVFKAGDAAGVLLWDDTNDHMAAYRVNGTAANQAVSMSIGTAALTAGKIRVMVEYMLPGQYA